MHKPEPPAAVDELDALRRRVAELESAASCAGCKAQYLALFEHAMDAIFVADAASGRLVDANRQAQLLIGRDLAEIRSMHQAQLHPPEDEARVREQFAHTVERPGEFLVESDVLHRDGRRIPVEINTYGITGADGRRLHVGIFRDIRERRRTEAELRRFDRDEARFHSVFESASVGIGIGDVNGRLLETNDAFARMLGRKREDMANLDWAAITHPKERDANLELFRALLAGRIAHYRMEKRYLHKNGNWVWMDLAVAAIPGGDGRVARMVGVIQDIDQRKRAEEKLLVTARAIEADLSGFAIGDGEGRLTYVNPAFLRLWGYTRPEEVLGRSALDFWDNPEAAARAMHGVLAEGNWCGELVARCKDGALAHMLVSASRVNDAAGKLICLSGSFIDITEHHQAEAALRRSRDELTKAARLKDEFMASMSHELRTPLTAILNLSETLAEGVYGPLNPRQVNCLHTVEQSGRHLLNLINDILDLSKIEAGQLSLQMDTCPAEDLCRAGWQLLKGMAEKKRLQYTFSIQPPDLRLQADARRLKQMLVNLLGNAIKFTPEGGNIGLEVTGDSAAREVCFTVWDTGIGIAAADLPRLFQTFTQLDSSLARQHSGTGLGLVLARRMAELHNGRIEVDSHPGQGSRFMLRLPWRQPAPPDAPPVAEDAPPGGGDVPRRQDGPGSKPLVLLAEDNEVNAKVYLNYLERKGYRLTLASDGRVALEQARALCPDLVLMDIQMPGLDGLEATRRIRACADPRVAGVPIIALTALAMPGDRERCMAAGANDYLSKPISLKRLLEIIETWLERQGEHA